MRCPREGTLRFEVDQRETSKVTKTWPNQTWRPPFFLLDIFWPLILRVFVLKLRLWIKDIQKPETKNEELRSWDLPPSGAGDLGYDPIACEATRTSFLQHIQACISVVFGILVTQWEWHVGVGFPRDGMWEWHGDSTQKRWGEWADPPRINSIQQGFLQQVAQSVLRSQTCQGTHVDVFWLRLAGMKRFPLISWGGSINAPNGAPNDGKNPDKSHGWTPPDEIIPRLGRMRKETTSLAQPRNCLDPWVVCPWAIARCWGGNMVEDVGKTMIFHHVSYIILIPILY